MILSYPVADTHAIRNNSKLLEKDKRRMLYTLPPVPVKNLSILCEKALILTANTTITSLMMQN